MSTMRGLGGDMRTLWICLCVGLALPAVAETTQELNKRVVTEFYELAFNGHRPTEAAKRYIGSKYVQHNPKVPNGARAFYEYFEGFFQKNPDSHVKIYRTIADGDLVALHLHSKVNRSDRGRAIVDLFRVEDGKIVEHFDVIQDVPETTANGNTMFDGDRED